MSKNKTYVILRNLGEGSFGKVKEAMHVLTEEKIAVKVLEKEKITEEDDKMRVRREIEILKKVRHPNIVQLYEVIETEKYFFLVMEHIQNGELSDYIETKEKLSESDACRIFHQLVSAVAYLHSLNISHRDIKPSNILMDYKQNIKLIDFGLGNTYTKGKGLKTSCGSPCFAAPEIINGIEYDPVKVDVWSLGVSLYCMLTGRLPFDEDTKQELYRKIRGCIYKMPHFLSPAARSLIQELLNLNPHQRPNPTQILKHDFFKSHIPYMQNNMNIKDIESLYAVVSYMINVDIAPLKKMILNNEHNKHTTVYYLMKRKVEKGQINIQKEREKIPQKEPQPIITSNRYNTITATVIDTANVGSSQSNYKKIIDSSRIYSKKMSLDTNNRTFVNNKKHSVDLNNNNSINSSNNNSALHNKKIIDSSRIYSTNLSKQSTNKQSIGLTNGFRSNIRNITIRNTRNSSRQNIDQALFKSKTAATEQNQQNSSALMGLNSDRRKSVRILSREGFRDRGSSIQIEKKKLGQNIPRNLSTGSREDHSGLVNTSCTPIIINNHTLDSYRINKLASISSSTGERKQTQTNNLLNKLISKEFSINRDPNVDTNRANLSVSKRISSKSKNKRPQIN